MHTYIISSGKGVPALIKDRKPQPDATNFRFLVGRGVTPRGLNLRISMPAVYDEDFAFQVGDQGLILFGTRRKPGGFGDYKKFALRYGNFHQRIALPPGLDPSHVSARFHHGVLDIQIFLIAVTVAVPVPVQHSTEEASAVCLTAR